MKKNQTNHKRVGYSLSLVALLLISGVTVASEPMADDLPALIILDGEYYDEVVETVVKLHGTVSHIFPPQVIFGQLSADVQVQLEQDPRITVYRGPVDITECEDWSKQARYAAIAWNNNYMGLSIDSGLTDPPVSPESPPYDTELLPDISSYLGQHSYQLPYGADLTDTSEYLVGSVAVGVLFLESNGTLDEDTETWTEEEEAQVTSEIQNGLNWLSYQEPGAGLNVVYEFHYSVPVGYEPITRAHTDDDLWEQQAMFHLGYTNPHYLVNEYQYVNDLRQKYDTDWAFIIFVVDSSEDEDNAFSDGMYAYSFLGGPRMVVTYACSIWGIANLDSLVAHETCHIFWALDQHCDSQVEQTAVSGYLAGENTNSEWNGESCTVSVPCIMKGEPMLNSQMDVTARKQIGWYDSDSDGILDVLDTAPEVSVEQQGNSCIGTAVVSPLPNGNPLAQKGSVSLNTIAAVEYKIGEGQWEEAEPADGSFDGPEEGFVIPFDGAGGEHTLAVKAQNSVGTWSDTVTVTVDVTGQPLLLSEVSVSPAAVNPGDTVLVTMTVTNTGEAEALDVIPVLTACDAVEEVSGPEPASADISPGDEVTFEWVYSVKHAEDDTFTFSGSAAAHTESGEDVASESSESNTVEVHIEPLLDSSISALLYGVIEGNSITVTMEVRNTGEATLENVTPSELAFSCTGTASANPLLGPLPQSPMTLEPGEMKTIEWKYTAASGSQGGTVVFTASVSGEAEETVISDVATATVGIDSPAILSAFVIATPKEVAVGDTITVAMTVQNIGKAEALDVVPSELSISGTGKAQLVSGPSRTSIRVEGRSFEIILWTYTAIQKGTVTFSGSAQGIDSVTGKVLTVPVEKSNSVTITGSEAPEEPESPEEPETPEEPESPEEPETPEEPESPEEPQPPTPPPVPQPQPECLGIAKTVRKVRELFEEAKALLESREKQNRDVRFCKKLLMEVEIYLGQAEYYLTVGDCEQANNRAITALLKVYEVINCLRNM